MSDSHHVPHVPAWIQNGFHGFLRPFLKRHFHAVGIVRQTRCEQLFGSELPLIVYGNHPSWWDPLIAHFLNRALFPDRQFFAPIDADALEQYRVFGKLGFYGVRLNTTSGAAAFLNKSTAILNTPGTAVWMTPEGRFADIRDHSAELMPGLAHLCKRLDRGWALPIALEYMFWNERLPVCLARMGEPISVDQNAHLSKAEFGRLVTARLRETQQSLSTLVMERSSDAFDNLLQGKTGAGFLYDSFRRMKSWGSGRRFRPRHGEQFE